MTTELVAYEGAAPPTLFGTNDPVQLVEIATAQANALARVIRDKRLFVSIRGREHVKVEGWTLLGSMLGVFPVLAWTKQLDGGGWEARVEARTLAGQIVGAAESQCTPFESLWDERDDYALRSMAQTRATSKALRLPLGFVMALAGYDATPAEEMPRDEAPRAPQQASRPRPPVGVEREVNLGPVTDVGIDPDDIPWPDVDTDEVPFSDKPSPLSASPVTCGFCHGQTWDNRGKKATGSYKPTSPDYSCKDKACGGIAWENEAGVINWKKGTGR